MVDLTALEAWSDFRSKLEAQKEVVLWANSKEIYRLMQGVWLPIMIYSPLTPLRLKRKIAKMYNNDKLCMLPRGWIDSSPESLRDLIHLDYLILCQSDKSPREIIGGI